MVYLHPWAEEMNKSRRMAALQSRALSAAGHAVLQIDLHGCGDSSGDLADASWAGWLDDASRAIEWLRDRYPEAPLWLWGLRAGCLLAAQAASRLGDSGCHFLFWQPPTAGKPLLQQFLRLKAAAEMQHGDGKGAMAQIRQDLNAGRTVDIAGYGLSPALANGLENATLDVPDAPASRSGRIIWLEVAARDGATLLPTSVTRIEAWRAAGRNVQAAVVPGPAFWQTQEIEDAPSLLTATLAAVREELST